MRILHIGKFYPPAAGGMERYLGDLVAAQRRAGDQASVLVHAHDTEVRDDPPWLMRCPVWMRLMFAPISPRFPQWLHRALRRFDPDVIHIHMPNPSAFWLLMPMRAARGRPVVLHWHSDVEPSRHKRALRWAYPHYRIFEKALLERADAIIVTSPHYLESSAPLAPWRHKCHVVPLAVDPARLPDVRDPQAAPWKPDGVRLLAVGRLTYYKGFETLVRAALLEPAWQLLIVGEGEDRAKLEKLLDEGGRPDRIRLLGAADDEALNRLMATCDIFCLPSRERTEAFGIVLLEAMRYSRPLAVSDLPGSGVTWVARRGQNAVHVDPEDVLAWREEINTLAARPAQREMLGRLGHQRYLREFDIERTAERVRGIYSLALRVEAEEALAERPVDDAGPPSAALDEPEPASPSQRILVVIPALNEAACIGDVIRQARAQGNIDVLVVDDGSTDDTRAIALLQGAKVISAPLWQGAWCAIQTGIRYAVRHGYSSVVTMDADGQHEPACLPLLVEAARNADVVIAACPSRGSRMRHVAWSYFRMLTGFRLEDLTSGFRYYNARTCQLLAAEEATLLDYQDIGVLLLLHRAELRIAEIAVPMNPRRSGASRVFSSWLTVIRYMAETTLLCLAQWSPPRVRDRARATTRGAA